MKKHKYEFQIKLINPSRANAGYEDPISEACLRTWAEVPDLFSNVSLTFEQELVEFAFDWLPVKEFVEKSIEIDKLPAMEALKNYERMDEGWQTVYLNCSVIFSKSYQMALHLLGNLMFHLFMVINLSSPGCFNLGSAEIKGKEFPKYLFGLDSCYFEAAWIESLNNRWPKIQHISLRRTWNWYQKLHIGTSQIAKTRTERALFAVLHICREKFCTPGSLIWLSHALESLYDTPNEQIGRTLRNRIFLFLDKPEENFKKYKQKISAFYDLRSSFVHGALDIHSPQNNDILDKNLDKYIMDLIEANDFAFSIIISSLQQLIVREWTILNFCENFFGDHKNSV